MGKSVAGWTALEKAEFGDSCKRTFKYSLHFLISKVWKVSIVDVLLLHHSIYNHLSIALPASVILLRFFLVSQLSRGPDNLFPLISFMLEQQ